jgi:2-keto-3-deoxy-L-rhamnonate aldolase RhmA
MIQNLNKLIKRKKYAIGTHIYYRDCSITELYGDIGYDFVWIDTEHSTMDIKEVQRHIIAARAGGVISVVRVAWNDPVLVKPILELGPSGIIFPFVNTAKEARKAVDSCLYPPKGSRGFGPRRAIKYGLIKEKKYIDDVNNNLWKAIQVEHIEAVNNLDEILEVEELDSILVGPYDLSGSMGLLGQLEHPRVLELMDEIGEKVSKSDKTFGVALDNYNPKVIKKWINRGIDWICIGADFAHILNGAQKCLNLTNKIFQKNL